MADIHILAVNVASVGASQSSIISEGKQLFLIGKKIQHTHLHNNDYH